MSLAYGREVEVSQNWEKLHKELKEKVLKLRRKFCQAKAADQFCWDLKNILKKKAPQTGELIESFRNPKGEKGYRLKER